MASDLPNEYTEHLRKRGFICEDAIGSGLSGMVVRATQENLGRPVAIKFLRQRRRSSIAAVAR